MMGRSKGDINMDFTTAIIFFIGIYGLIYISLPSVVWTFRTTQDSGYQELVFLSDIFVTTAGIPQNWTAIDSDLYRIGLAHYNTTVYPNILDLNKLQQLNQTNCSLLKTKVDTTFDFQISITTQNGPYQCANQTPPKYAKYLNRIAYVKSGSSYNVSMFMIQTW